MTSAWPALAHSCKILFHETGLSAFGIDQRTKEVGSGLHQRWLERAVGIICQPETERRSHRFSCPLADRMGCVIHLDRIAAIGHSSEPPFGSRAGY